MGSQLSSGFAIGVVLAFLVVPVFLLLYTGYGHALHHVVFKTRFAPFTKEFKREFEEARIDGLRKSGRYEAAKAAQQKLLAGASDLVDEARSFRTKMVTTVKSERAKALAELDRRGSLAQERRAKPVSFIVRT